MLIHLYVCIGNDGDDDCALQRLHRLAEMYVGEVAHDDYDDDDHDDDYDDDDDGDDDGDDDDDDDENGQ